MNTWTCLCGLNHNVADGKCLECGSTQWRMKMLYSSDPYRGFPVNESQRFKQAFMRDGPGPNKNP